MKFKSLFILLTLLFICSASIYADTFIKLSTEHGLSNRRVFQSTKDHKGYLWFATAAGIDRYNGESFTHYYLDQKDNRKTEKPKGILSTPANTIYAYTEKTLTQYNPQTDQFDLVEAVDIPNNQTLQVINPISKDSLWIGTSNALYLLTMGKDNQLIEVYNGESIYSLAAFNDMLALGTKNGILLLDLNNVDQTPTRLLKDLRIQSLLYDEISNQLWIGTFSKGVYTYNAINGELRHEDANISHPIRSITAINDSTLWIGADGEGLYQFNRFAPTQKASKKPTSAISAPANGIYDIQNDLDFIWISTYDSGILVFNKDKIVSNRFVHLKDDRNSLINNHVNAIIEDQDERLWFGTNAGLSIYNPKQNHWDNYDENNSVLLALHRDQNNDIWVGGYARSVYLYSNKTRLFQKLDINHSSQKRYIYDIFEDDKHNIWLGGIIDGLFCLNTETGQTNEYAMKGVNSIVQTNLDTLIMATARGVLFFDKKTGTSNYTDFRKLEGNKLRVSYPLANVICKDPRDSNLVWIGFETEGLVRFNISQQTITQFSTKEGLSSNTIYGIVADQDNRLWISTEDGLNCLDTDLLQINVFQTIDGLPSDTFNPRAFYKRKNGNIIWGTVEGAFEINPSTLKFRTDSNLNLVLEKFKLFYTPVVGGTKDSPLEYAIDDSQEIKLSHKQHSFSFEFIDLDYFNKSKILYSWKLEGFNPKWSIPSQSHEAAYTNIPPGKYTFKVKAIRADNEKIMQERSLIILITPPWWASNYAILAYTLVVLLFVYYGIRYYKNRLESKDSDQNIQFFISLAHDIRTPLSLIKAPLNEIAREPLSKDGKIAMELAKANIEKLLNMVSQLLDFQKIEKEAMALHVEETSLNSFIDRILAGFIALAKEKQINITIRQPKAEQEIWIDRKKIELILDNLLSNALKYTPSGKDIRAIFEVDKNQLVIRIEDDGIGISSDNAKKIFKRFYRADNVANSNETGSGIGLLLTKRTTLLHKGNINFTSTKGVGSIFTVRIPIDKNDYKINELLIKANSEEVVEQKSIETDKNQLRLLIVEDNESLRKYLVHYFSKKYEVIQAEDGLVGLDKAQKQHPDFIISDILMPRMSGTELCNELKSNIETCHIPFILLTSITERDEMIKNYNAGADGYITKPFDLDVLESKLEAVTRNRALYHKKCLDKSAFTDQAINIAELDKEFLSKVVTTIEDKLMDESFSVDVLATEMAMSRTVFYNKINALTGHSPIDLILDIKMKKAAGLIKEKSYLISEVAYLVGYSNPKNFSTAFKKYYGVSPSQF